MRCKHAFRPISAGFAAIQLEVQGLDQLILYSIFYFHKFFTFCQTNFLYIKRTCVQHAVHMTELFLGKKVAPCTPENTVS
jgi:hypothetical protein